MHDFLLLARVLFKNNYNFDLHTKQGKKAIAIFALLLVCMVPYIYLIYSSFVPAFSMGFFNGMLLQMAFSLSGFLVIWTALFLFPTIFYFSADTQYLLPLPVQPMTIVLAKTFMVWISCLAMSLLTMIPVAAAWISTQPFTFSALLIWIGMILTSSLIPLFLTGILILVVMRFLPYVNNKDRFNMIMGIVSIPLAVAIGMSSSLFSDLDLNALAGSRGIDIFSNVFFYYKPVAQALDSHTFLPFLLYLLILAAVFVLFLFLAQKLYLAGVLSASAENTRTKKTVIREEKTRSLFWNLLITENRRLVRSPAYFSNCVLSAFVAPIMFSVMFLFIPEMHGAADLSHLPGTTTAAILFLIGLCVGFFMGGLGQICSTAFSREGQHIDFLFYTPMNFSTIIHSKLILGVLYGFLAMLLMLIPLHVIARYPAWMDLIFLLGSLLCTVLSNQIGLLVDGIHPKLIWDDETTAIKNNLNVLFEMFFSWLLIAVLAIPLFAFGLYRNVVGYSIFVAVVLVAAACILWVVCDRIIPNSLKKRNA